MAKVLYERSEGGDFGRMVRVTVVYLGEFRSRWYLMESGIFHANAKTETWHQRRREVIRIPEDLGWSNADPYAIHVGIARWKSLQLSAKSKINFSDVRLSSSKKALLAAIDKREAHDPLQG